MLFTAIRESMERLVGPIWAWFLVIYQAKGCFYQLGIFLLGGFLGPGGGRPYNESTATLVSILRTSDFWETPKQGLCKASLGNSSLVVALDSEAAAGTCFVKALEEVVLVLSRMDSLSPSKLDSLNI